MGRDDFSSGTVIFVGLTELTGGLAMPRTPGAQDFVAVGGKGWDSGIDYRNARCRQWYTRVGANRG